MSAPEARDLTLFVDIEHPLVADAETLCTAAAAAIVAELNWNKPKHATVKISTDAEVQTLNNEFRGQDKPTNVLSFPDDSPDYLGDIIIASETVKREAEEQEISVDDHFSHLVVHGILHLMGFDHMEEDEAEQMEELEIQILAKLNIKNPYL